MVSPLPGRTSPGRTSGSAGGRKRLLFGAAALLLVLDAALLGVWAVRRAAYGRRSPGARVAGMFATLRRQGLAAALDTLELAAAADSVVLRDAHQLAHALGREAVRASGGEATPLAACRPAFASGCYHGVIEAYLAAHGRIDMPALERLCVATGSAERPGPIAECMHGLGHGVLGAVDLDVDSALRYCDALVRPGAGTWCYAGVFMEAVNAAMAARTMAGHHGHGGHGGHRVHPGQRSTGAPSESDGRLALDPADLYSPCDRFGDPYAASCWLFQGFLLLRGQGFDVGGALRACDSAPRGRAGDCYEGVGLQFTGLLQRDDGWDIAQCARGMANLAPRCAAGVARALDGMDWSGARAARFCGLAPVAWKGDCYRTAGELLMALASPGRRKTWCANIESEYRSACSEVRIWGE